MSLFLKIILIIIALAYLITPFDIIPDILLPFIGWIDDGVVLATIFYLVRYGKLPNFLVQRLGPFKHFFARKPKDSASKTNQRGNTRKGNTKKSQNIPRTPHEILGVRSNASKKEIQAAYKEAIKKYHPDKVSHLGDEFATLANEKFVEIQNAYDTLMKT